MRVLCSVFQGYPWHPLNWFFQLGCCLTAQQSQSLDLYQSKVLYIYLKGYIIKHQCHITPYSACRQVNIKNPVQYEVFTIAVSNKPPSITVTVKLNSSGVFVSNFTLLVFNNTELILQNSTQTESLKIQIPSGILIFVVEKNNIKQEPHTFQITRQTTNITIVVSLSGYLFDVEIMYLKPIQWESLL